MLNSEGSCLSLVSNGAGLSTGLRMAQSRAGELSVRGDGGGGFGGSVAVLGFGCSGTSQGQTGKSVEGSVRVYHDIYGYRIERKIFLQYIPQLHPY